MPKSQRYQIIAGGRRGGKRQRLAALGHQSHAAGGAGGHESVELQVRDSGVLLGEVASQWKGRGESRPVDHGWVRDVFVGKAWKATAHRSKYPADRPRC